MIEINNLTTNSIDEEFLKKIVKIVLKSENKEEKGLSIALLGQGRMRKLNKKYRRKNKVTDVLSFGEIPSWPIGLKGRRQNSIKGLGEVVICLREVKKNAKRIGLSFEKELARVLIHGMLHLLGYDHEKSKAEAKKMEEREENYLVQLEI